MEIGMSSKIATQYAIIAPRPTFPFKSAFQALAVERNANRQPLLGDERGSSAARTATSRTPRISKGAFFESYFSVPIVTKPQR